MAETDLRFGTYTSVFETIDNLDATHSVRKISRYLLKDAHEPRIELLGALSADPQPHLMNPEGFNGVEGQPLNEFYPYREAGTLDDQRHRLRELLLKEQITEVQLIDMMRQLIEAVGYIHDMGFIHSDVRPNNICIDGTVGKPNIILFDYSSVKKPYMQTQPVDSWNPEHPPEIADGDIFVDYRFDVYSIGKIFFDITRDSDGSIYKHLNPDHYLFEIISAATAPYDTRPENASKLKEVIDSARHKSSNE